MRHVNDQPYRLPLPQELLAEALVLQRNRSHHATGSLPRAMRKRPTPTVYREYTGKACVHRHPEMLAVDRYGLCFRSTYNERHRFPC